MQTIVCSYVGNGKVATILLRGTDEAQLALAQIPFAAVGLPPVPVQTATSAAPSAPAPGSTGAVGLWSGICTGTDITSITNAAGTGFSSITTTTGKLRVRRIALLADGTFTAVVPREGLSEPAKTRAREPDYWGTWEAGASGGSVKLDRASTRLAFTHKGEKLIFDGCDFTKSRPLDGTRVDGSYTAERRPDVYQRDMGREPVISFTAEGRFSDQGALYWIRHVRGYSEDRQDANLGEGTYEVSNYTLILRYDDGRQIRIAFFDAGGAGPRPAQINLGALLLDRR